MKLGFTGTSEGMSKKQKAMLAGWMGIQLLSDEITEAHHGCCVGADAEFHELCMYFDIPIFLHPPKVKADHPLVAWDLWSTVPDKNIILSDSKHLERNRRIVDTCDFLCAAPPTDEERPRGGTWYTIRYARDSAVEHRILKR